MADLNMAPMFGTYRKIYDNLTHTLLEYSGYPIPAEFFK